MNPFRFLYPERFVPPQVDEAEVPNPASFEFKGPQLPPAADQPLEGFHVWTPPDVAAPTPPDVSEWEGSWPDFAPGQQPLVAEGYHEWNPFTPTPVVPPDVSQWIGHWPDFARAAEPLVAEGFIEWNAFTPPPPVPPDVSTWQGSWPDFARVAQPIVGEGFTEWNPLTPAGATPAPATSRGLYDWAGRGLYRSKYLT